VTADGRHIRALSEIAQGLAPHELAIVSHGWRFLLVGKTNAERILANYLGKNQRIAWTSQMMAVQCERDKC
jgi:hypothetical protein